MLDGRPFLYSNILEILLARGARTILWGGAVKPRQYLLESCILCLDY